MLEDNQKIGATILAVVGFLMVFALVLLPAFSLPRPFIIENQITTSGSNFTDTTVCVNVGTGIILIKSSVDGNCEVKTLVGSPDINIFNDSNTVTIDYNGTTSGESTQCVNVGNGTIIIKNSTSGNCYVKTFKAGSGLSISNDSTSITYSNTAPESTTCNNLGIDVGLTELICAGGNVNLKGLYADNGISLSANGTYIFIRNIKPESTLCSNLGGQSWVDSPATPNCDFKGITVVAPIVLTNHANDLEVSCPTCSTQPENTTDNEKYKQVGQLTFSTTEDITKTNLPTSYTDIYAVLWDQEEMAVIHGANVSYVRIYIQYDFVGAGTDRCRIVDSANNANVVWESATFAVDQNSLGSGWIARPSFLTGDTSIELQCKSSNGTNDPVVHGYQVFVK